MLNYVFVNEEEELFHVIRTRGTTYENYKDVVEKYIILIIQILMIVAF